MTKQDQADPSGSKQEITERNQADRGRRYEYDCGIFKNGL